jgi:hypothetical protein
MQALKNEPYKQFSSEISAIAIALIDYYSVSHQNEMFALHKRTEREIFDVNKLQT